MKHRKSIIIKLAAIICLAAMLLPMISVGIFAETPYLYLSDMSEAYATLVWKPLSKDKGFDDNAIKIADTTYEKGLVIHAPSRIEYNISGDEYEYFHAFIGVNDSERDEAAKSKADVEFIVMIDGVYVYKSKEFYYNTPAEEINIPIPYGAKRLILITTQGKPDQTTNKVDGTADHCAWADAKLVKRSAALPTIAENKRINETLKSPSGNLSVNLKNDENGRILFNVVEDGVTMLEDSAIGIASNLEDFTLGFSLKSTSKEVINETYQNLSGSYSTVVNHANKLTAVFEKGAYLFTLEFLAYDDGFAYRFTIDTADGEQVDVVFNKETGYFAVPDTSKVFSEQINYADLEGIWNYERSYVETTIERCANTFRAFPVLYTPDDKHWMLLSEAELFEDTYAGSAFYATSDNNLRLCYAPKVDADGIQSKLGFTSPWRCGITGDLGDIVESSLIENVCKRQNVEDFSWVKPGVASWLWLSEGGAASGDLEKLKEYVKLSSDMGWDYILLDAGWQPSAPYEYYDWFRTFVTYARKYNVGVWVWVHYSKVDTPQERTVFKKWADDGVKGVKVDFFDSEDQNMIQVYEEIYKACAEAKLMLNIHGANKPTGERQYWPHIINREAVLGEEYKQYSPFDLACYAFTRGVLGPMDITPLVIPGGAKTTTTCAQLAMCVHYETGCLTMASFAEDYYDSKGKQFLTDLPSRWDDLEFIDGYPGDYSILARRNNHNWYLSGITSEARKVKVKFDFLEEGEEYEAYIYTDGSSKASVKTQKLTVTSADSLDVSMLDGGGFAVKFVKLGVEDENTDGNKTTEPSSTATGEVTETVAPDTAPAEEKSGCGSSISYLSVLAAIMLPIPFIKRKEDN